MNSENNIENNRQAINEMIAICDKAILKLNHKGRHVEASAYIEKKRKLIEALNQTDKVEETYKTLLNNPALNGWFSKTLSLSITMADLAMFYADMANAFLSDSGLIRSTETKSETAEIRTGIDRFRCFYSDLMEKHMKISNCNLFDGLEKDITRSFFNEQELEFYNKYSE